MSKIETLVKDNKHLYPRTIEKAIYDDNGVRLDNKIGELKSEVDGLKNWQYINNYTSKGVNYVDLSIYNEVIFYLTNIGEGGIYNQMILPKSLYSQNKFFVIEYNAKQLLSAATVTLSSIEITDLTNDCSLLVYGR